MPTPWNPNAPGVLGLEWFPIIPAGKIVVAEPVGQRIRSRSAETITALRWAVRGAVTRDRHMMIVDIYENGQEILTGAPGMVRQVEYSPNADSYNGGWYRRTTGATTNLWQAINENPVSYPPVRTDLGIFTTTGIPTEYRCRVASGAFSLTARVLRLEARYVIAAAGYEWRDTDFRIYWAGAGGPIIYNVPGSHVTTHMYGKNVTLDLGEINPVTQAPWTPADVRAFSTASGFELRVEGVGNPVSPVNLLSLSLKVTYQDTENRVAAAIWRRPATEFSIPRAVDSDRIVTLPTGAANWAKATAKDYTFMHRLAADPLVQYVSPRSNDVVFEIMTDPGPSYRQPRIAGEASFADNPIPALAAGMLTLDQWGRVVAVNSSSEMVLSSTDPPGYGWSPTRLLHMLLLKAGVVSEDSQPYGSGGGNLPSGANRVYTGFPAYQEMAPPSTTTYLGVEFLVFPPDNTESTLTVQITTVAGANVGGAFTITRAQALLLPEVYNAAEFSPGKGGGARRVSGFLASGAALTSGTTYRVTFSSNAPSFAEGWKIGTAGVADSSYTGQGVAAPLGGLATFQSTTGRGTWKGAVDNQVDLCVRIIQQPLTPVVSAAIATVVQATPPDWVQIYCYPDSFEAPDISWTASAYTGFLRWEVEREEADALGYWWPLVRITSEAQKSYRDYTAKRGVAVRYRVRAILNTGAWSDWGVTNQIVPRAKGAEVLFTSDAKPGLTVAYDREPSVTYEFLNPGEDTFVIMAGLPYQTVFGTPVERGVRFEYAVIVNAVNEPAKMGVAAFNALRRIANDLTIPYVVVLDHEGNRFYAHIQMAEGVNEQPEHVYTARVTVTEITDTPVLIVQP